MPAAANAATCWLNRFMRTGERDTTTETKRETLLAEISSEEVRAPKVTNSITVQVLNLQVEAAGFPPPYFASTETERT